MKDSISPEDLIGFVRDTAGFVFDKKYEREGSISEIFDGSLMKLKILSVAI